MHTLLPGSSDHSLLLQQTKQTRGNEKTGKPRSVQNMKKRISYYGAVLFLAALAGCQPAQVDRIVLERPDTSALKENEQVETNEAPAPASEAVAPKSEADVTASELEVATADPVENEGAEKLPAATSEPVMTPKVPVEVVQQTSAEPQPQPGSTSYKHIRGDNHHYKTLTLDMLALDLPEPPERNQYGGDTSAQHKATGFFRVEKIDGVWSLIDPLGNPFYSVGLTSVNLSDKKRLNQDVFDNEKDWVEHTDQMMEAFGFNTYANWCDHDALKTHRRPFTERITLIAGFAKSLGNAKMGYGNFKFKNDVLPVFHPEFEDFAAEEAGRLKQYRDDPYLIGVFSDNELPFSKVHGCLKGYLGLDESDAGHQAAKEWLKRERIDVDEITKEHDQEFYKLVLDRYFSVARGAIKKVLPNHMYIGTRFHGMALRQDDLWEISGKYVDVNSVNYYHRWTPEQERILKWEELSGRPMMVTEFYAKAKDSGLDNSKGAGFDVDTQQDRADFYQNYCIGLLRSPAMVGWHWFRYIDDLKPGVECNKGVLNKDFEPYQALKEAMMPINKNVYPLRNMLVDLKSPLLMDKPVKVEKP